MLLLYFYLFAWCLIAYLRRKTYTVFEQEYKKLPFYKYYKFINEETGFKTVYTYKFDIEEYAGDSNYGENSFMWLVSRNGFSLNKETILYINIYVIMYDPYTLYWWIKYTRWCRKNINFEELENW